MNCGLTGLEVGGFSRIGLAFGFFFPFFIFLSLI